MLLEHEVIFNENLENVFGKREFGKTRWEEIEEINKLNQENLKKKQAAEKASTRRKKAVKVESGSNPNKEKTSSKPVENKQSEHKQTVTQRKKSPVKNNKDKPDQAIDHS